LKHFPRKKLQLLHCTYRYTAQLADVPPGWALSVWKRAYDLSMKPVSLTCFDLRAVAA
jgi:hypothetical protein